MLHAESDVLPEIPSDLGFLCIVALPVAGGLGWFANHWIVPRLVSEISGSTVLAYDPEQAVSTMLAVWAFIWLTLVGTTPDMTLKHKCLPGVIGVLAVLVLYVSVVMLIETFRMSPTRGC